MNKTPVVLCWVDSEERVEHICNGRYDLKCPKCGYYADDFIEGNGEWWCCYKPNYCPNCGANLRGENK